MAPLAGGCENDLGFAAPGCGFGLRFFESHPTITRTSIRYQTTLPVQGGLGSNSEEGTVKSSVKVTGLDRLRTPLLAVVVGETTDKKLPTTLQSLDSAANGELTRAFAAGDFSGKSDQTALLYPKRGPKRVLLVGSGKAEEMSRAQARRCGAVAARRAVSLNAAAKVSTSG